MTTSTDELVQLFIEAVEEARRHGDAERIRELYRLIGSRTLAMSRDEYEAFREVQLRQRWDWPATFSTNSDRDIWPFITRSRTPRAQRVNVRGMSPLLDRIADACLNDRQSGGRFFINETGAYCKVEGYQYQIVSFEIVEP
jgi:hypothetical protein